MVKDTLLKIFYWLGIIVVSTLIWSMTVGFYDLNTKDCGLYPTALNKGVYNTMVSACSDRLLFITDSNGRGYRYRTEKIWTNNAISEDIIVSS